MEYPLTAHDRKEQKTDVDNTSIDVTNESIKKLKEKKHRLGELISMMEKNIKESKEIIDKIKWVYYEL